MENKHKLLNPILSRFCEIYVPEYVEDNKIVNLHQYSIQKNFKNTLTTEQSEVLNNSMINLVENMLLDEPSSTRKTKNNTQKKGDNNHFKLTHIATQFYEMGLSCLDIIQWLEKTDKIPEIHKSTYYICYDNIKSEYRCEKLLMLYMLDFIFLRSNKDVKCVIAI